MRREPGDWVAKTIEEIGALRCVDLFDLKIGCRSLKIHRVELALSVESTAGARIGADSAKAELEPESG